MNLIQGCGNEMDGWAQLSLLFGIALVSGI